ncbi:DUF6247 family protein [Actinomadura rubrisoli]|uniref:Uncharacterized protein n=1 Tax=Actinomadura rubrisoli TaxID=2530368 RepID=A0A4R5ABZ0_9ACTN|nr:DUF6247 family protein [Actinomadura rubrisoli]TDD68529.1 hypothetical protein E1298_38395 [Actinomadura rubrisoli]
MSAQPVHNQDPADPCDPEAILSLLPKREHPFFLSRYREHVQAAATDLAKYKDLQRFLQTWSIRARALRQALAANPNYYEEVAADREGIQNGTVPTVPIEEALAQVTGMSLDAATAYWQSKVERARQNRA